MKTSSSGLKYIYWFAYYNLNSPSVRYRGMYPLELLNTQNINYSLITPHYSLKNIFSFIKVYFSALLFRKSNSLIVIQRINSNFIYANLLKLLVKIRSENTVYDIDDADYLELPPETIYYFIKNCSSVSVGSRELQINLSRLNKNVHLNTSPTPDMQIIKSSRNEIFTIGWIGCFLGGHKKSMINNFFPALKQLPFKARMILLGVSDIEYEYAKEYFKDFEDVIIEMPQDIEWRNENSIQNRIVEFDVGIATLLDDELHRSKSAFKLKQYFNNGVPVLSSDIPENNNFVLDGYNGFLCSTAGDFRNRLIQIQSMTNNDYRKLSDAARSTSESFNLHNYTNILKSVYKS